MNKITQDLIAQDQAGNLSAVLADQAIAKLPFWKRKHAKYQALRNAIAQQAKEAADMAYENRQFLNAFYNQADQTEMARLKGEIEREKRESLEAIKNRNKAFYGLHINDAAVKTTFENDIDSIALPADPANPNDLKSRAQIEAECRALFVAIDDSKLNNNWKVNGKARQESRKNSKKERGKTTKAFQAKYGQAFFDETEQANFNTFITDLDKNMRLGGSDPDIPADQVFGVLQTALNQELTSRVLDPVKRQKLKPAVVAEIELEQIWTTTSQQLKVVYPGIYDSLVAELKPLVETHKKQITQTLKRVEFGNLFYNWKDNATKTNEKIDKAKTALSDDLNKLLDNLSRSYQNIRVGTLKRVWETIRGQQVVPSFSRKIDYTKDIVTQAMAAIAP